MKLNKLFFIILILIFSLSFVHSTKFIKNDVRIIKNHKGYPAESFEPKVYYGLSIPDVESENEKDYSDFRRDYIRDRSNDESFFDPLKNIDEKSLYTSRRGTYRSEYEIRKTQFEDLNMNRINLFKSYGYSYTDSENYENNDFY
ncbi:MAG: hypothetical protein PF569_02010 [Candidatus Woesearchaeota archaeon]|jgi:hypothetical protein|nr:hypothetical protein [Candidatus Woesearchaeota archaeon]